MRRFFRLPSSYDRLLREADEEVRGHLEEWTAEFVARGMSEADAQAEAMRRFGDLNEFREHLATRASRIMRRTTVLQWLDEWTQDIRFALRQLTKARVYTAVAILTLALGIGANTAIFSVVHRLLLDPLAYPNGNRVVALKTEGSVGFIGSLASMAGSAPGNPPQWLAKAWATRTRSFEAVAGVDQIFLAMHPDGRQDTVTYARSTANLLRILGAHPTLGRAFLDEEERPAANHVAMISQDWWMRAYGGRESVLGLSLEYEGQKYTIVGVMPAGFTIPMTPRVLDWLSVPSPDVWLPAPIDETSIVYGLLRPGAAADAATRELNFIANDSAARAGDDGFMRPQADSIRARAMHARDFLSTREVRTVEILFVAVGVLLLVACANVANLLLLRAWGRRREFAVRLGLGAGRARLVRLALTESVMLAVAAGGLGVFLAWQGLRAIIALRPLALDRLADVRIEPAVLLWAGGISVLTGLVFGAASAVFVSSQRVAELLRSESRSASSGGASRRFRSALIVAEIALSFVLLVGAGLLTRSYLSLQDTQIGFAPGGLVSVDVLLPPAIQFGPNRAATRAAIRDRLAAMPQVSGAAYGMLPTAGFSLRGGIEIETATGPQRLSISQSMTTWIDSGYFRVAGIELIRGRVPRPGASDEVPLRLGSPRQLPPGLSPPPGRGPAEPPQPPPRRLSEEIVISLALAKRIAPDGNVMGMQLRTTSDRGPSQSQWSTIVGVSEDVHVPGARGDLYDYQVYTLPLTAMPNPTFVVRFSHVPSHVESELRETIQSVNATIIARRSRVANDYVREALAPTRFTLALLGTFAAIALTLAIVGLYGSIAYSVGQRTREIGIRMALGASSGAVSRLVIGDGARLSALGIATGLGISFAVTRFLSTLLYDTSPNDGLTYVVIAVAVAIVALAASTLPTRRAMAVDPVESLRAE
jgi:putative ABC transport system permease protein